MAKKDDFDITTTAGRRRLDKRTDPYFRREDGGHLGFRCTGPDGDGTWIGRAKDPLGKYQYMALGRFKDYREALQAFATWIEGLEEQTIGSLSKDADTATVGDAARRYLAWIDETRESESARQDIRARIEGLIIGREKKPRGRAKAAHPISKVLLCKLTKDMLEDFHRSLLNGQKESTADRKTKNTANRNWVPIVAMLNKAKADGLIRSSLAWDTIETFTGAAAGHKDSFRYASKAERAAVLKAIPDGQFKDFAELLCVTGTRPSELMHLTAGDYDRKDKVLHLWTYKGGKRGSKIARTIPVGVMGDAWKVVERCTKDKLPAAPLFTMAKRQRNKAMKAASTKAKVKDFSAYCFRHSFMNDCIESGVNVLEVARICGTSMAMIQKTYGKLLTASVAKSFAGLKFA